MAKWYYEYLTLAAAIIMSIFDALKAFGSTSVKVTCPECGFATQQPALKVRKNITLVCPKCGHYFLPKDK